MMDTSLVASHALKAATIATDYAMVPVAMTILNVECDIHVMDPTKRTEKSKVHRLVLMTCDEANLCRAASRIKHGLRIPVPNQATIVAHLKLYVHGPGVSDAKLIPQLTACLHPSEEMPIWLRWIVDYMRSQPQSVQSSVHSNAENTTAPPVKTTHKRKRVSHAMEDVSTTQSTDDTRVCDDKNENVQTIRVPFMTSRQLPPLHPSTALISGALLPCTAGAASRSIKQKFAHRNACSLSLHAQA
jgi:hypothetical protein